VFTRSAPGAPLVWTGQVPARLDRLVGQAGLGLRASLGDAAEGGAPR
jgi:hypothetical protein